MRVLIDLSYTQCEKTISGIYEYGKKIFVQATEVMPGNIGVVLIENVSIDSYILKEIDNKNIEVLYLSNQKGTKKYWKEMEQKINASDFDRVFFPYQLNHHKMHLTKEYIFSILDLSELSMSKLDKLNEQEKYYACNFKQKIKYDIKQIFRFFKLTYFYRCSNLKHNIKNAYKIYTISEYVKNDIKQIFKTNIEIPVFYAPTKVFSLNFDSKLNYKNYVLLISANRYIKNAYRELMAIEELYDEKKLNEKTIILGNLPISIQKKLKFSDNYICLPYVSSDDLEYLYKNARIFLFSSLCEGFGYPPLEAMKYGTNVCVSNSTSLDELYNVLKLHNPYSVNDIKNNLLYRLSNYDKTVINTLYTKITEKQINDLDKTINYLFE